MHQMYSDYPDISYHEHRLSEIDFSIRLITRMTVLLESIITRSFIAILKCFYLICVMLSGTYYAVHHVYVTSND